MATDLTERTIQQILIRDLWSSSALLMPNYQPRHWWECDLYRLTKARYFYEYEIKLTRSDFKADRKKREWHWGRNQEGKWRRQNGRFKLEAIIDASSRGPKQFWYVVPQDLIGPEDIPDWAGLMYVRIYGSGRSLLLHRIRTARSFNRPTVDQAELALARERAYYRYLHSIR